MDFKKLSKFDLKREYEMSVEPLVRKLSKLANALGLPIAIITVVQATDDAQQMAVTVTESGKELGNSNLFPLIEAMVHTRSMTDLMDRIIVPMARRYSMGNLAEKLNDDGSPEAQQALQALMALEGLATHLEQERDSNPLNNTEIDKDKLLEQILNPSGLPDAPDDLENTGDTGIGGGGEDNEENCEECPAREICPVGRRKLGLD